MIAARIVDDSQELMLISEHGVVLRTQVLYERIDLPGGGQASRGIPVYGRSSQGVTIMNIGPGDAVASVAVIELSEESGSPAPKGTPPKTPPPNGERRPAKETPPRTPASKGERRPQRPATMQPRAKAPAKGPTSRAVQPAARSVGPARPRASTPARASAAPRPRTSGGGARPTTSYRERYESRVKTAKVRDKGRTSARGRPAQGRPKAAPSPTTPKASSRTSKR